MRYCLNKLRYIDFLCDKLQISPKLITFFFLSIILASLILEHYARDNFSLWTMIGPCLKISTALSNFYPTPCPPWCSQRTTIQIMQLLNQLSILLNQTFAQGHENNRYKTYQTGFKFEILDPIPYRRGPRVQKCQNKHLGMSPF